MQTDAIPTADDLTAPWFTDLLRSTGMLDDETTVSSVSIGPFGSDESMMSSLHRATLTYDRSTAAPERLVVKLASDNEGQLFVAGLFKFYEREVRFYREVAEKMSVSVPRCHLARIDPATQRFVLVLDEIQGRRSVDQLDGVGFDDAVAALHELADFHAPHWGADLESEAETFLRFDSPLFHAIIPDHFAGDWAKVRPKVIDELPAEIVEMCDNRRSFTKQLLEAMHGPDTLCHGDFRSDNLLFADDGAVLALDYQLASVAHGMTDVAYFVSQSVDEDVAATRADDLVGAYAQRLAIHGIDLDLEAAMDHYRAGLVFYISIPIALLGFDEVPDRADRLARTMLRRVGAEILRTGAHRRFA